MCNIKTTTEEELKAEYNRAVADKTYRGSFKSWLIITINSWEMMHGLSKEQKSVPVSERAAEERAIAFAEWIALNNWMQTDQDYWNKLKPGWKEYAEDFDPDIDAITTVDLFAIFQQQQSK